VYWDYKAPPTSGCSKSQYKDDRHDWYMICSSTHGPYISVYVCRGCNINVVRKDNKDVARF
jgi:hypothetical protein